MSSRVENYRGQAPDARVGNPDAAFMAVALYSTDMADPSSALQQRPEGFTNTEVEWVVLLPSGATGADIKLWRWVDFFVDRTNARPHPDYPAGAWHLEQTIAVTSASSFVLQYGNGLGLQCTVDNIAGSPSGNGYIGVRGLTKRS